VNFFIAIILGVIITECFFRLPFRTNFLSITSTLNKSLKIIRSKNVSDHWKERVILRYSSIIFTNTLKLACYLSVIVAVIAINALFNKDFFDFLTSTGGLAFISVISLSFIKVRMSLLQSEYGLLAKFLHYVALDSSFICEASFDIEQASLKHNPSSIIDQKHVFIAGLARAGTTILMRRFHSSCQYSSLTYNDMPFVLMPTLWGKISSLSRKQLTKVERAHGDGLLVDYNSPEAFEEVFWRIFSGDKYIKRNKLLSMIVDDEVINKFRLYVASILSNASHEHQLCYLSKNNNNILRLPCIQKAFPKALIIVPFRDPLQQADSLLQIHKRFVELHKTNKFISKYMSWLVHHEFGHDHRPYCFDECRLTYNDPDNINYWLQQWLKTYRWINANAQNKVIFLSYETLCTKTDEIWSKLSKIACIPKETQNADIISLKQRQVKEPIDEDLLRKVKDLYCLLMDKESSVFGASSSDILI